MHFKRTYGRLTVIPVPAPFQRAAGCAVRPFTTATVDTIDLRIKGLDEVQKKIDIVAVYLDSHYTIFPFAYDPPGLSEALLAWLRATHSW